MRNPILAIAVVAGMGYGVFNTLGHMPSDRPVVIPDAPLGASPTAPRPVKENVVAYYVIGDKGDASLLKGILQAPARFQRDSFVVAFDA